MGARQAIAAACIAAGFLACRAPALALTEADRALYAGAVTYCRSKPGQLVLNSDRTIFCFDGWLSAGRDVSSLKDLRTGGLFVVRSNGGSGLDAIKIAVLLAEKQATVVTYDFCISACAHFFFVASEKTYVSKETIVAWHHGWQGWPVCDQIGPRRPDNTRRLIRTLCNPIPEHYRPLYLELRALADPFFSKRVVIPGSFNLDDPPQSIHIAKVLRSSFESTGRYPSVVWMWNPRYHKASPRTEVTYEAYPGSQDQVDELTERFFGRGAKRLFGSEGGRILYDP